MKYPRTLQAAHAHARTHRPADWYTLNLDEETDTAVVDIFDEIGFWGTTASAFTAELDTITAGTITLRINSPGGEVWDGVAIYNALRDHPARIEAVVYGVAASAASVIAMAGDQITMKPATSLMIHDAWGGCIGNAAELREYADLLDQVSDQIAGIYAARAGGTPDAWRAILRETRWYTPEEALAAGLVDLIETTAEPAPEPEPETRTPLRPAASLRPTERTPVNDQPNLDAVLSELADLRRQIGLMDAHHAPAPALDLFAGIGSLGAYVSLAAKGDQRAHAIWDAVSHTTSDTITRPAWLGVLEADMQAKTPILSLFDHTMDLPDTGNSVAYGEVVDATSTPAKQTTEGADLVSMGKVTVVERTAPVYTVGGWSDYSLQWVKRASVETLDLLWKALTIQYARYREIVARARLDAVYDLRDDTPTVTSTKTLANLTALDWRAIIVDFVEAVDDTIWPLSGFVASPSVFKQLATLPEQKAALQVVEAPDGKEGTIEISTLDGKLDGFRVTMRPNWTGDKFAAYYRSAIRVQESAGAPFRLTDNVNPKNLTELVSLYGFMADYAPIPSSVHVLSIPIA